MHASQIQKLLLFIRFSIKLRRYLVRQENLSFDRINRTYLKICRPKITTSPVAAAAQTKINT
jgi:hypothetical protein